MSRSLRVLAYHRVAGPADSPGLDPRLISASPQTFNQQMKYLAKHYNVVSLRRVFAAVEQSAPLPSRAVLITFDDAYHDFTEHAWPILQHYGLTATIFVPTAYPDHPEKAFWWDRLYRAFLKPSRTKLRVEPLGCLQLTASSEERWQNLRKLQNHVKSLPHAEAIQLVDETCRKLVGSDEIVQPSVLNWEQLRKLAGQGVAVAAHTRTHPILTQLSSQQVRQEVSGSQRDLEREMDNVLPVFCYPDGGNSDEVIEVLRDEGFRLAFGTVDGQNDLAASNLLRLSRTTITPRTSLAVFRLRLLRLVSYLDKWRHRKRQSPSLKHKHGKVSTVQKTPTRHELEL